MKLSEKDIQRTCDDFLALDGWRAIVTDPPHLRGLGVTEKGIPDRLYIRYANYFRDSAFWMSQGHILWIEWKKKGGKAGQHQLAWHERERAHEALVLLAGVDFEASIEGFQKWYRASGLMRRKI